jgi:hypothetical protein
MVRLFWLTVSGGLLALLVVAQLSPGDNPHFFLLGSFDAGHLFDLYLGSNASLPG